MGAIGPGIYQNDVALDLKGDYADLRKFGIVGDEALRLLRKDVGEENDFWIALADLSWRDGIPIAEATNKALQIAESASELERWPEALRNRRIKVLNDLAQKLSLAAPKPKKIPPRFLENCPWRQNEILAYERPGGNYYVLRVVAFSSKLGGRSPVVEVLDWRERRVPSQREVEACPVCRHPERDYLQSPVFTIFARGSGDRGLKKVNSLGFCVAGARSISVFEEKTWVTWSKLAEAIAHYYGWYGEDKR